MASGVAKLGGFEAGLYAEAWVPFVKVWRLHTPSHPPSPLISLPLLDLFFQMGDGESARSSCMPRPRGIVSLA